MNGRDMKGGHGIKIPENHLSTQKHSTSPLLIRPYDLCECCTGENSNLTDTQTIFIPIT